MEEDIGFIGVGGNVEEDVVFSFKALSLKRNVNIFLFGVYKSFLGFLERKILGFYFRDFIFFFGIGFGKLCFRKFFRRFDVGDW